jgi:hypothetical protein
VENIREESSDSTARVVLRRLAQALFYPEGEYAQESAAYEVSRPRPRSRCGSEHAPVHDLVIRGLDSQTAEIYQRPPSRCFERLDVAPQGRRTD